MSNTLGFCGGCHKCVERLFAERRAPVTLSRMLLCPECGNKRCPKASDHDLLCTGSNKPGQKGSVFQ